ncbi:MarR family winged helix-turn-helix transcriptional regulator [Actinophytocola gossypii]|uniref:MarR family transcriptional regulator n=1 Tax=Actinophytocola gossypii TaxID=2812003 RepID=A0ABT2JIT2_9PSEU|nr:MarR family transcriptional regulator [Actinophytocola gossypii]MCT2587434.1 MarR family transcriptional regulator [Actinophytocola gossypii]
MADPAVNRLPNSSELEAWRAFLRAHARLIRVLETELVAEHPLSLGGYDVLVQLAEAPERRLRMAELADAVLLSRSGVTRLVDRLEVAGMVTRERFTGDGRGIVAVLTTKGVDTLRDAARTHLSGVVRHFIDHFDDKELAAFGELCARLSD